MPCTPAGSRSWWWVRWPRKMYSLLDTSCPPKSSMCNSHGALCLQGTDSVFSAEKKGWETMFLEQFTPPSAFLHAPHLGNVSYIVLPGCGVLFPIQTYHNYFAKVPEPIHFFIDPRPSPCYGTAGPGTWERSDEQVSDLLSRDSEATDGDLTWKQVGRFVKKYARSCGSNHLWWARKGSPLSWVPLVISFWPLIPALPSLPSSPLVLVLPLTSPSLHFRSDLQHPETYDPTAGGQLCAYRTDFPVSCSWAVLP